MPFKDGLKGNKKDKSLLWCISSLIAFILILGFVFVFIYGISETETETELLDDEDVYFGEAWIGTGSSPKKHHYQTHNQNEDDETETSESHGETTGEVSKSTGKVSKTTGEGNETGVDWRTGFNISIVEEQKNEQGEQRVRESRTNQHCKVVTQCLSTDPLCITKSCNLKALQVRAMMNPMHDPCKAFYGYACGGVTDNPHVQEIDLHGIAMKKLIDQSKFVSKNSLPSERLWQGFYQSCLDYDRMTESDKLEATFRTMRNMGHLQFKGKKSTVKEVDLTGLIAKLMLYDESPLFDIDVEPKTTGQHSEFVLTLTPPKKKSIWNVFSRKNSGNCNVDAKESSHSMLHNFKGCELDEEEYLNTIEKATKKLRMYEYDQDSRRNLDYLQEAIKENLHFLKNSTPSNVALQEALSYKKYRIMRVEELQKICGHINWSKLMKLLTNHSIDRIHVYMDGYFDRLSEHMEKKKLVDIYNSLLAMFAYNIYNGFLIKNERYYENKEKYCMEMTSLVMKDVTSSVYLKCLSAKQSLEYSQLINSTFEKVKISFEKEWKNSHFDEKAKAYALEKLRSLKLITDSGLSAILRSTLAETKVKNYEDIISNPYIEDVYQFINYIDASLSWLKDNRLAKYNILGNVSNYETYLWPHFHQPFQPYVKVIHEINGMVVPLSLISSNEISHLPHKLLLGDLGVSIAQGISRIFSPYGINYDSNGEYHPSGQKEFENGRLIYNNNFETYKNAFNFHRSHNLNDSYLNYIINSTLLLSDKYSDDNGLQVAFKAAAENDQMLGLQFVNVTSQQLFFITAAQKFCKKNPVSEFVEFTKTEDTLPSVISVGTWPSYHQGLASAFNCPKPILPYLFDVYKE